MGTMNKAPWVLAAFAVIAMIGCGGKNGDGDGDTDGTSDPTTEDGAEV